MSNAPDIKAYLKGLSAIELLIYLQLLFFVVALGFSIFFINYFAMPSAITSFLEKPWTVFTYAFIHFRFFHIFGNLLVLFYIGNLFLDFFSEKQFWVYYISGILAGGLSFILYYYFRASEVSYTLVGSSAAVSAILVGLATKIPRYALRLRFVGSVELWLLTAVWVGISALGVGGVNGGSGMAHLGGALMGFVLTYFLGEGKIKRGNMSKPKATFKKVYTNTEVLHKRKSFKEKKNTQRKVDEILDKISKSGYDALTKEEKDFLFNQKED